MIGIDLLTALAVVCSALMALLFFFWHAGRAGRRRSGFLDPRFIRYCSVCTYSYVSTRDEQISACPRCGSLNKRADDKK